ncbi:hypothetical protein SAMN04488543_3261 [Friedmanniella luteola]|uniref:Uncharacterized protein n=1 Tax=Friedmanniella luteola TaxID=546871 RepID=A0A1H1YCC0_9ACTN|nr:hypothetical protein [Friedmanniella luteola]SDT19158.1 hypothetical protein SAMN04488543_3261 [Friedmanniella luteola]
MRALTGTCVCGHPGAAHEHYRRGTDCALCAPGACRHFRTHPTWRERLSAVLGSDRDRGTPP